MKTLILSCFSLILGLGGWAQKSNTTITGQVTTPQGEAAFSAVVYVKNTAKYAQVDSQGYFKLHLEAGTYQLIATAMGYEDKLKTIHIEKGQSKTVNFSLSTDPDMMLDEILIRGKSEETTIEESSYAVDAVNVQALQGTSMDLSQVLERASGINVRRSGGVGSDYSVMLNGFTGRHVKLFINGIPMEGFSSAFQLNNMPVDFAKRIEVYKGVVPIGLGADALGGAINIITNKKGGNFLNASYSYGSFNTHKSYVNAGYTTESGFTFRLTAFQNYSDNDYKVNVEIVDLETKKFTGDYRKVRRFHDMYRNYTVIGKIGLVNKPFADQLLLGFTYGDEYDEIQHPGYMKLAFGQKYTTSKTLMPSLTYQKTDLFVKDLNVSLKANYNFGKAKSIDDSYRRYNWLGEYIVTDVPGEFGYTRRFYENQNGAVNANIEYSFAEAHKLAINNVLNTYRRTSRDEAVFNPLDKYPQKTLKNILGVAYTYAPNDRLSATLFGKHYLNKVSTHLTSHQTGIFKATHSAENLGYGAAASYFLLDELQLDASYERAYRLPTARELFGAPNNFILGNIDLKPEHSDNLNIGLRYNWKITDKHRLQVNGTFIYRDIRDFIHLVPNHTTGALEPGNEALVKNRGVDLVLEYRYDDLLTIGGNLTYQDLRNKLKYKTGKTVVSTTYNDRIPNIPYLYGGAHASVYLHSVWQEKDALDFNYSLSYVHEFDYSFESYGGREIPEQISHNLSVNYSFAGGKYRVSLACRNLLDAKLYDRYSIQLPGRSFSVKFRYFLNNF